MEGQGFDYYKYLSNLNGLVKQLQKFDKPNMKIIKDLQNLKNKISVSKMPIDKKDSLISDIDGAEKHFNQYSNYISSIEQKASQELS